MAPVEIESLWTWKAEGDLRGARFAKKIEGSTRPEVFVQPRAFGPQAIKLYASTHSAHRTLLEPCWRPFSSSKSQIPISGTQKAPFVDSYWLSLSLHLHNVGFVSLVGQSCKCFGANFLSRERRLRSPYYNILGPGPIISSRYVPFTF